MHVQLGEGTVMKRKRLLLAGLYGLALGIVVALARYAFEGSSSVLSVAITLVTTTGIAMAAPILPEQFGLVDRHGNRLDRPDRQD
jgi:hypothetical protein